MTSHQATFTLERADFVRTGRAMFHSRRDARAIYLFLALAAVLAVGGSLLRHGGPNYWRMALSLGALLAIVAGVWASPWLAVYQNLKNHTTAFERQTWSFTPAGVDVEAGPARSSFQWPTVLRVVENSSYLFFYVSDGMAYPVPKRAFADDELGRLAGSLREWLGHRAQLK